MKKANKSIIGTNTLLNPLKFKNDSDFIFPYEPINYMQNQNKNASNPFFNPNPYLNQQFCSFNSKIK